MKDCVEIRPPPSNRVLFRGNMTPLRILKISLVAAAMAIIAPTQSAGVLGTNIVAMFPRNTAEFAYADLKEARKFPWYAQFKSQTLPVRLSDLEHFLAAVGVDDNLQIDELAWSLESSDSANDADEKSVPDSGKVLGVALGSFDADNAKSYMKKHRIEGSDYRGYTIYPCVSCDDLSVVFIDSSTVAFGHSISLQRLIDVRVGSADSLIQNDRLFPLIAQIKGRGIFWGVFNPGGTRQAVRQLVPEATQFPQAGKIIATLNALIISIQGSDDLEAHFQLVSSSPDDAATIAQLLQAGILFKQFGAKSSDPDLETLLGSVRLVLDGDGLDISVAMTSDQILNMIKRNAFSAKR